MLEPKVEAPSLSRRWLLVPLALFAGLALLLAFALSSGDPSRLPSALIGKAAPTIAFAPLEGLVDGPKPVPGVTPANLASGEPVIVNFWASWCAPCVEEHPLFSALKEKTGVAILGVNYKDQTSAARRFLGRYGNPFTAVGVDPSGRGALEWGVYGMPETFVLNGKGEIVFKHVGPISPRSLETQLLPAIERARAK